MKEFNNILKLHPQHASLPALPLPGFADKTIKVLLNDYSPLLLNATAPYLHRCCSTTTHAARRPAPTRSRQVRCCGRVSSRHSSHR